MLSSDTVKQCHRLSKGTAAKTLVQAFITCHLDYCNSLLYGVSNNLMQKIQSVQNAAARLVTITQHCKHITPVLKKIHWLLTRQRVEFKLAYLVHQSLAGQTPKYLTSGIQLTANTGRPQLRSASICVIPQAHTTASVTEVSRCRTSCVERLAIISVAGHELDISKEH